MKKWIGCWPVRVDGAGGDAGAGVFGLHGAATGTVAQCGAPPSGRKGGVEFAGQTKRVAGEDDIGVMQLDAINDTTVTGGLKVTGENILLIKGVLVGEVWFALRPIEHGHDRFAMSRF